MAEDVYLQAVFWVSLAGVLFSGYLSAHRLIKKECAFNEPCPYFLNFPACWFGFLMYLIMFGAAAAARSGWLSVGTAGDTVLWVSLFGIFFAGYYTVQELIEWVRSGMKRYALVLPTCAYGLVFYTILFILSLALSLAR